VEGVEWAFSICRDTFFDDWQERFESADIWVDLKANGQDFTKETEVLFSHALPERIAEGPVELGATVCLTGEYLDLFWEGRSSVIEKTDAREGPKVLLAVKSPEEQEILFLEMDEQLH